MPGPPTRDARWLLGAYAAAHEQGVATGHWQPVAALFSAHGRLRFEGLAAGPWKGDAAIAAAFTKHPPDDRLVLGEVQSSDDTHASAAYGWSKSPGVPEGSLEVRAENGYILELVVRVDVPLSGPPTA